MKNKIIKAVTLQLQARLLQSCTSQWKTLYSLSHGEAVRQELSETGVRSIRHSPKTLAKYKFMKAELPSSDGPGFFKFTFTRSFDLRFGTGKGSWTGNWIWWSYLYWEWRVFFHGNWERVFFNSSGDDLSGHFYILKDSVHWLGTLLIFIAKLVNVTEHITK